MGEPRTYAVTLCPLCGCQQPDGLGGFTESHFSECPNRGKTWAAEEIEVVPLADVLALLRDRAAPGWQGDGLELAANLIESHFKGGDDG